jgi:hypothetical protein
VGQCDCAQVRNGRVVDRAAMFSVLVDGGQLAGRCVEDKSKNSQCAVGRGET